MSPIPLLLWAPFVATATSGKPAVQKRPDCETQVERALAAATAHHKRLLVKFGASWCEGCRSLERFLVSQAFQKPMGRHYDVLCIDYDEDLIRKQNPGYYPKHAHLEVPGAKAWLKSHGLNENMPEVAILDEKDKTVVCYERPYRGAQPWERLYLPPSREADVSVALRFFADGNPAVTRQDLRQFRDVLSPLCKGRQ